MGPRKYAGSITRKKVAGFPHRQGTKASKAEELTLLLLIWQFFQGSLEFNLDETHSIFSNPLYCFSINYPKGKDYVNDTNKTY